MKVDKTKLWEKLEKNMTEQNTPQQPEEKKAPLENEEEVEVEEEDEDEEDEGANDEIIDTEIDGDEESVS